MVLPPLRSTLDGPGIEVEYRPDAADRALYIQFVEMGIGPLLLLRGRHPDPEEVRLHGIHGRNHPRVVFIGKHSFVGRGIRIHGNMRIVQGRPLADAREDRLAGAEEEAPSAPLLQPPHLQFEQVVPGDALLRHGCPHDPGAPDGADPIRDQQVSLRQRLGERRILLRHHIRIRIDRIHQFLPPRLSLQFGTAAYQFYIFEFQHLRKYDYLCASMEKLCLTAVIALVSGWFGLRMIVSWARRKQLYDLPDDRKRHKVPIPRLGGLCFLPAIALSTGLALLLTRADRRPFGWLLAAVLPLYVLGIHEDLHRVHPRIKFIVQIAASFLFLGSGIWLRDPQGFFGIHDMGWFSAVATVALFLHIVNAVNLIDGIDGLAAEVCLYSAAVSGAIEFMEGDIPYALFAVAVICTLLPFLWSNLKGRLFMGDTGCWTLGAAIIFLALHAGQHPTAHPDRPYLLVTLSTVMIPLLDMARVALYRVTHHISVVQPDNRHIHHLLLQRGFSPRAVRLTIFLTTTLHIALNLLLFPRVPTGWLILGETALCVSVAVWLNTRLDR